MGVSGVSRVRDRSSAQWVVTLYPDAGEACGAWVDPMRRHDPLPATQRGVGTDEVAVRRSRSRLRRYMVANRLNRFGSLTYAGEGCHDPKVLRRDLAAFFRELRSSLGGNPFPYVWVPELHKTGHGWHAHFGLNRYVNRSVIDRAWGHGFVHIKLFGNLPHGSTARDEARKAARYASKYLGKDLAGYEGLHRYEVAQGFQPAGLGFFGKSASACVAAAAEKMGADPGRVWLSASHAEWDGPPAVYAEWR